MGGNNCSNGNRRVFSEQAKMRVRRPVLDEQREKRLESSRPVVMDKWRWIKHLNVGNHRGELWNTLRIRLASWIAIAITVVLLVSLVLIPFLEWFEFYVLHIILMIASVGVVLLLRDPVPQPTMQQLPDEAVALVPALAPAPIAVASCAIAGVPAAGQGAQPVVLPEVVFWPELKEGEKDIPIDTKWVEAVFKEGTKDIATKTSMTFQPMVPPQKVWEKEQPTMTPQTMVAFKEAFKTIPYQERPVSCFKQWVKIIPQAEVVLARSWDDLRRVGGVVSELVGQLAGNTPLPAPVAVRISSDSNRGP